MKTNKDKMEAIGNVVINYNYYSGEDLYSEGASEDTLLRFAQNYKESDYDHIIQNTRSWSVMYHFSHVRENICSWLPIKKTDKVLEVGAGCGAVTGCLAELAGKVTCIDLSKKRSLINAYRHKSMDNIEIVVGNFEDIEKEITEKYDYITLIGVFEYAESYISSEDPYHEFLNRIGKHLTPNGKIIIAIENKLGLKYFAGCKEDHTGRFFEGIEGYTNSSGVKTFSRDGLSKIVKECGFESRFYYPYPDYKLPHTIYSDSWLPKVGELNTNIRNFDSDRVVVFDETKVFDTFIEEGKFCEVSNSFLVIATPGKGSKEEMLPIYTKYANERSREYRIATIISADGNNEHKTVRKLALNRESNKHVDGIYSNYLSLKDNYDTTGFMPNSCRMLTDDIDSAPVEGGNKLNSCVELEFLKGMTLESYLDELENKKEFERMLLLIKEYEAMVYSISKEKFTNTDKFKEVFGEEISGDYTSAKVTDLDMIFSNIVFDEDRKEDGEWNVLDYEWTYSFPIPAKFIVYRALYYYIKTHEASAFLKYLDKRELNLFEEFKISKEEQEVFNRIEKHFQVYIIRGVASLEVMHELMPVQTLSFEESIEDQLYLRNLNNPKLYYGTGEGFSNDKQLYIFASVDRNRVKLEIPLSKDITEIRIDPTEYPCILKMEKAVLIQSDGTKKNADRFLTNGFIGDEDTLLFDTDDSQIQYYNLPSVEKTLKLMYSVSMVDDKLFGKLRDMFMDNMERNKKEPTVMDKVLIKVGKKQVEAIPEGLWYNRDLKEGE